MEKLGHKDVASSIRLCRSIMEDAENILASLPEGETEIPTWWTNKLAICYAYINSLRDYIVYEGVETKNEALEDEMEDSEEELEDEESEDNQENQLKIGDYTTQHFDICPSAVALYSDILSKTDMIHLVVESMMLHDLLFKLEKFAIAMGVADTELVDKAQHYADMIMALAREMNLESEHTYIENVHMSKFKELAVLEVDESMLPPSVRLVRNAT
jgi:hypothetical protein